MPRYLLPPLLACLLAACGDGDADAPLRLAYQNRVGSLLFIVAAERHLFAGAGVAVEAMRFNSGPACAETLYTGSSDVATMGDTTAIIAVSRGGRHRIVASHGAGEHRHRIMVRADGPIAGPADLAGRRLAVKKGTSTYGGLLAFCAARGVDPDAVELIDLRPSEMPGALAAGAIDAFAASEPTGSLAEERGARELATLGGLDNAYPILVVARADVLDGRPDAIRGVLVALRRAERWVAEHPDAAAALLAEATGLSPAAARRSMRLHRYRLSLDAEVLNSLERTAAFLRAQGIVAALPDLDVAADPAFLPPEAAR